MFKTDAVETMYGSFRDNTLAGRIAALLILRSLASLHLWGSGLCKRKIPTFPGRACLNPKPSGIILLEPFAICPFGCGFKALGI